MEVGRAALVLAQQAVFEQGAQLGKLRVPALVGYLAVDGAEAGAGFKGTEGGQGSWQLLEAGIAEVVLGLQVRRGDGSVRRGERSENAVGKAGRWLRRNAGMMRRKQ